MTDRDPTDRDASPTSHDKRDIARAAKDVDDEIDRREGDIPKSRRERSREQASRYLSEAEGTEQVAAVQALQQASAERERAQEMLQRARKMFLEARERHDDATTAERILQNVVSERAFLSDAASSLTDSGPAETDQPPEHLRHPDHADSGSASVGAGSEDIAEDGDPGEQDDGETP